MKMKFWVRSRADDEYVLRHLWHHSSMHYFAAPTKNALGFNHGCSTVNTDGRDCMCSGFKKSNIHLAIGSNVTQNSS